MSELMKYQAPRSDGLRALRPRVDVAVRLATQDDFANIDALQKQESDGVGFQFEQAIRKRIEQGNVILAQVNGVFAGYCLGVDRYQKRSELGIIYQIAVVRKYRRSLVAATLLQAQFDKSAYGTRLYCCWCKQSLAANRFWEAMGFVPLAFRAAGRSTIKRIEKKEGNAAGAVHIFWQKKIRVEDQQTSGGWWYPYETSGGAMMEGRIVLPLPPDVQWHEATPVVLPGAERRAHETRLLEAKLSDVNKREREAKRKDSGGSVQRPDRTPTGIVAPRAVGTGGFAPGSTPAPAPAPGSATGNQSSEAKPEDERMITKDGAELARLEREKAAAKKALKAAQRKNDPQLVAYARELRDRWQEQVAPGSTFAAMIEAKQHGQYHVARQLAAGDGGNDEAEQSMRRVRVVNAAGTQAVKALPEAA